MSNRNLSIEGLRGYLILFIVLFHFTCRYFHYGNAVFPWTIGFQEGRDLGNVGFLILSGYFLAKNLFDFDTINGSQLFGFIVKKVIKLYIPFVVSVLFLLSFKIFFPFLENVPYTVFLKNIFLFRLFAEIPFVDGAHWYLFTLLQLTIIFSLSYYFYRNKKYILALLVLAGLVFLKQYMIISISNVYLAFFICGGLLLITNHYKWIIYMVVSCTLVFVISNYSVLFVCAIIPVLLFCNYGKRFTSIVFENKLILTIGKYSFMWYLVHQQLGYFFITFLSEKGVNCYLNLCLAIFSTFAISVALHHIAAKINERVKI